MKTLISILMLSAFSWSAHAQEVGDRIHDLLSDQDGVISLSMNQSVDQIFDGQVDIEELGIEVTGESDRVQVSVMDNDESESDEIAQRILSALSSEGLESVSLKEDNNNIVVWVAEFDAPVNEIHLTITGEGDKIVYITIYGDFTVIRK